MSKPVDCRVFQDQLDSLAAGALPPEGLKGLYSHARSCPDCEALLKMHEHLASSERADLEAAVPDEYVEEMWPRVRGAIAKAEAVESLPVRRRRIMGWPAAALAAACLVLIAGSAFLYSELIKIKEQERVLSRRLALQVSAFEEARALTLGAGSRTYTEEPRGLIAGRRLQMALSGRDRVTVGELMRMLGRLPADMEVLNAAGAETAIRRISPWGAGAWAESAAEIRTEDGLQVGEAIYLIEAMGFNPDMSISADRLVSLSRGLLREGAIGGEGGERGERS